MSHQAEKNRSADSAARSDDPVVNALAFGSLGSSFQQVFNAIIQADTAALKKSNEKIERDASSSKYDSTIAKQQGGEHIDPALIQRIAVAEMQDDGSTKITFLLQDD